VKRRNGYIVWTVYFDAEKSWGEGRRVPRRLSVERPDVEEVVEAAKAAGYRVVAVEPGKRYPAWWFEGGGRIVVAAEGKSKNRVLYEIAARLVEMRKRRNKARKKRRR